MDAGNSQLNARQNCRTGGVVNPQRVAEPRAPVVCGSATGNNPVLSRDENTSSTNRHGDLYQKIGKRYIKGLKTYVLNALDMAGERGKVVVLADPRELNAAVMTINDSVRIGQLGNKTYVIPNYVQEFWISSGRSAEVVNAVKDIFNPDILLECTPKECVARRGRGTLLTCGDVESNPGPPLVRKVSFVDEDGAIKDGAIKNGTLKSVFCRAASNGKQSPATTEAAAEVIHSAQILNERFGKLRDEGRYGALCQTIIGLLRGDTGTGEKLQRQLSGLEQDICSDDCPGATCDPDGPRPECLQCNDLRGTLRALREAAARLETNLSRDSRQAATSAIIEHAAGRQHSKSIIGCAGGRRPKGTITRPSSQNMAMDRELGVCRYVRDAWMEISTRHMGKVPNRDQMDAVGIARHFSQCGDPEEVEAIYTIAASISHPYCVSGSCEHETAVALLSSALYRACSEVAREESSQPGLAEQCHTHGESLAVHDCPTDEAFDCETRVLGRRGSCTVGGGEILAGSKITQSSEERQQQQIESATGGTLTSSADVRCLHSSDPEHVSHAQTNRACRTGEVTQPQGPQQSGEERTDDVRRCSGNGPVGDRGSGVSTHGVTGRFNAPQFCEGATGIHEHIQLANQAQPSERIVATTVGCQVGSVCAPICGDPEGGSDTEDAFSAAYEYVRAHEANVGGASAILPRNLGPQRLCSQRVEGDTSASTGRSTGPHGQHITAGSLAQQVADNPSCITVCDVPGGFNITISPEQARAISKRFGYTIGVWLDKDGLPNISFRQVRETTGQEYQQRSQSDSSTQYEVQHDVWDVHESDRTRAIPIKRPCAEDPTDRERDEFFHEGPNTPPPVEFVRRSSKCELRSIKMGHALQPGGVQDNAWELSGGHEGSSVRESPKSTTDESWVLEAPHSLRSGMRSHEWRYDHSARQLLCSSCNHYSLPGAVKRRCLQKRRIAAEAMSAECPSYQARITRSSKYVQCGAQANIGDAESHSVATGLTQRVVRYTGRRRRPRANMSSQTCQFARSDAANLVGIDGTQADRGAESGATQSGHVLPTQAPQGTQQLDHDAGPNEDGWKVVSRKRRLPKQPKALPEDRVQNARRATQWHASAGATVLQSVQSRTWTRNERQEHTPIASGTGIAMVQAGSSANEHVCRTGTPHQMSGNVGSYRGATDRVGNYETWQPNTPNSVGSAHGLMAGDRARITEEARGQPTWNNSRQPNKSEALGTEAGRPPRRSSVPAIDVDEYYRHPHKCSRCRREYTHTHWFRHPRHRDYSGQCPYEDCSSYHGGNNSTKARKARGSLLTCGDVETNPGPCDKCAGKKPSYGSACPKCKRCVWTCCNCWVNETTNKDLTWYSKKEKRVFDLCICGDIESNPGPNAGANNNNNKSTDKRRGNKRKTVQATRQVVVPQPKHPGRGRLSAVIPRATTAFVRQPRLPLPEMTHALADHEMTFLRRIMSPGSEKTKFDSNVRIPDGALPNSAAIALREMETVVCPFRVSGDALTTTLQWTLIYLRLPLLKMYAIFIAVDQQGELSIAQELAVKNFLNESPGAIPQYPSWADVEASVKICGMYWEQLDLISLDPFDETRLLSQFRHCNYSATMYFNTPDLVNQGVCIGGQWNLDIKPTTLKPVADAADQVTILTQGWASLDRNPVAITDGGAAQSPNNAQVGPFQVFLPVGTITFAGFPNGAVYNATTDTVIVSQGFYLQNGQAGTVQVVGGAAATVTTGNEYRYIYVVRQSSAASAQVFRGVVTRVYDATADTQTFSAAQGSVVVFVNSGANFTTPIDLTWILTDASDQMERYQIVLPPLRNKSIVQSTPKFVMYLMKGTAGWYQVNRVFQPVFNLQQADTQRHIRFAVAGQGGQEQTEYTSLGGIVDTYDLNFSVGVVVMSGMSYTASPTFKFVSDIEIVADEGSPWQTNMMETTERCDQVIGVARTMMDSQPFLYPEYYNSMGVILNGIGKLLGGLPIVSNVMPILSKFMSSVMGKPSDAPMENGTHANVAENDIAELIKAILNKLAR